MNLIAFVLVLAAGVLGVVAVIQSAWKSLVGYALVAFSLGVIVDLCTHLSRTIHT